MKLDLKQFPKVNEDGNMLRKFFISIESDLSDPDNFDFVMCVPGPHAYIKRGIAPPRSSQPAIEMATKFINDIESGKIDLPDGFLDRFAKPYRINKCEFKIDDNNGNTIAYIDCVIVIADHIKNIIRAERFEAKFDETENRWEIRHTDCSDYTKFVDDTDDIDDILNVIIQDIST